MVEAHATAVKHVSEVYRAILVAMTKGGLIIVGCFDHEGLHQLQKRFVADENLRD